MKQIVFSCSHSRHTQLRLKRSYVSNGNKILFKSKNYPRNDNQWHTKKHTLEKRLFLIIFVFRFKSQIYDERIRWWWLTKYSTFNIVLHSIQYELFRFFFFAVRSDLQQNDTQQFIVAVVVVVVTFFLSLWYFFCLVFAFTAHLFNRTDSCSLSLSLSCTIHFTAQHRAITDVTTNVIMYTKYTPIALTATLRSQFYRCSCYGEREPQHEFTLDITIHWQFV